MRCSSRLRLQSLAMSRCAEVAIRHLAALRSSAAGCTLAGLLAASAAPVMMERSFRLSAGALAADRFLLSVPAAGAPDGVLSGLAALGLPAAAAVEATALLPQAAHLHLGLEADGPAPLFKLYLEAALQAAKAGDPLHTAWKWRKDGALARDRYMLLQPTRVAALLADLPTALQPFLRAVLATLPAQPSACFALEVVGEDDRRSLDLRCYEFDSTVGDIAAPLAEAAAELGVPAAIFDQVLARHRSDVLGHVACGLGRDGRPFLTVYAGALRLGRAALS